MSPEQRIVKTGRFEEPSLMPNFYRPPLGLPLYWRDEVTGELERAVMDYYRVVLREPGQGPLSPQQLKLLRDYVVHFINAPCWERNCVRCGDDDSLAVLKELRARAATLASVNSIARWTEEAAEIALDPW